ncbi:MAG: hypothetical protein WA945_10255 [Arcobacteraceae bacterium]
MTHEEFKNRLNKLNLNLKTFGEIIDLPYSTVSKWGRSNGIPSWLDSWFDLYEKNQSLESVKNEIILLAEKLK